MQVFLVVILLSHVTTVVGPLPSMPQCQERAAAMNRHADMTFALRPRIPFAGGSVKRSDTDVQCWWRKDWPVLGSKVESL